MILGKREQTIISRADRQLEVQPGSDPARIATVVVAPLESGFGLTLGSALRRVLLSSLRGAAIIWAQIEGVSYEFLALSGVFEEVTEIILNIKGIGLRLHDEEPKRIRLRANGPGEVRAGMIELPHGIEIMNPDHLICTLDKGAKIAMEFAVESGRGYRPATDHRLENAPVGAIPVDALFSPVRKVSYRIDNTRVGKHIDYDRLLVAIETNGAVTPEDAIAVAARILQDQLQPFVNIGELQAASEKQEEIASELPLNEKLRRKVDELGISIRSSEHLKSNDIIHIGDLVQKSEPDLLRMPSFNRRSLDEIKKALVQMGLHLGMEVPSWEGFIGNRASKEPQTNTGDVTRLNINEQHKSLAVRKEIRCIGSSILSESNHLLPPILQTVVDNNGAGSKYETRAFKQDVDESGPTFSLFETAARMPLSNQK